MKLKDETVKNMMGFAIEYCGRKEALKLVQRYYGDMFLLDARNNGKNKKITEQINHLLCLALDLIEKNNI